MTPTLIERLNERAHDPKRATDEGRGVAHPPAEEAQIARAEAQLGFRLPELLRELYLRVGNGGFGPGNGLFVVPTSSAGDTIVGHYPKEKSWPLGLLPLCDWGSGILSCVDCSRPEATVIRLDPNMPLKDVPERVPAALHYVEAARVGIACWIESGSLEGWLTAWVDGGRLFYAAYGGTDDVIEDEEDWDDEDE